MQGPIAIVITILGSWNIGPVTSAHNYCWDRTIQIYYNSGHIRRRIDSQIPLRNNSALWTTEPIALAWGTSWLTKRKRTMAWSPRSRIPNVCCGLTSVIVSVTLLHCFLAYWYEDINIITNNPQITITQYIIQKLQFRISNTLPQRSCIHPVYFLDPSFTTHLILRQGKGQFIFSPSLL